MLSVRFSVVSLRVPGRLSHRVLIVNSTENSEESFVGFIIAVPLFYGIMLLREKHAQNERKTMPQPGKIARFPAVVREELNQRLFNGEKCQQVIAWLNGLPAVQAVVNAEFAGQPVTPCNLSNWKATGYKAWREIREMREATAFLLREMPDMPEPERRALSKRIGAIFIGDLLMQLRRMDAMREGAPKSRLQRDLLDRFLTLQSSQIENERLRVREKQIDFHREWERRRQKREIPDI
jgi:hypothetical protein